MRVWCGCDPGCSGAADQYAGLAGAKSDSNTPEYLLHFDIHWSYTVSKHSFDFTPCAELVAITAACKITLSVAKHAQHYDQTGKIGGYDD